MSAPAKRVEGGRAERRELFVVPILVWLGLMLALAVTYAYAVWPHSPIKPEVALFVAAMKAALIAFFYMKLSKAPPLIRLAAAAAFLWILILFALAFADYLTRPPAML